jgi:hypothetical protein
LYWQVERPEVKDYRLMLSLLDSGGRARAGQESFPAWGPEASADATGSWRSDLIFPDVHMLDIGPKTKPGLYRLTATIITVPDKTELLPAGHESSVDLGQFEIPAD